jgi:hypothetical protein
VALDLVVREARRAMAFYHRMVRSTLASNIVETAMGGNGRRKAGWPCRWRRAQEEGAMASTGRTTMKEEVE